MAAVRFPCPHCSSALNVDRTAFGGMVRCPVCEKTISLPPLATPAAPPAGVIPPPIAVTRPREDDDYQVRDYDDEPPAAAGAALQKHLTITCRVCSSRLHFRADQAGKEVNCPDCDTRLKVPGP